MACSVGENTAFEAQEKLEDAVLGHRHSNSPQESIMTTEDNDYVISLNCSKAAPPPKSPASETSNARGAKVTSTAQNENASDLVGEESSYYEQDKEDCDDPSEGQKRGKHPNLTPFSRVPDIIYDTVIKAKETTSSTSPPLRNQEGQHPPLFPRPTLNQPPDLSSASSSAANFELGTYDDSAVHMVPDHPDLAPKLPAIQHKKEKMVRAPLHPKPDRDVHFQSNKLNKKELKASALANASPSPSSSPRDCNTTDANLESSYEEVVIHQLQNDSALSNKSLEPPHLNEADRACSGKRNEEIDSSMYMYADIAIHRAQPNTQPQSDGASKHKMKMLALDSVAISPAGVYDDITIHGLQGGLMGNSKLPRKPQLDKEAGKKEVEPAQTGETNACPGMYDAIIVHKVQNEAVGDCGLQASKKVEETAQTGKTGAPLDVYDTVVVHKVQNETVGDCNLQSIKKEEGTAQTGKTDARPDVYDMTVVHKVQNEAVDNSNLSAEPHFHDKTEQHETITETKSKEADISESSSGKTKMKPELLPKPANIPLQDKVRKSKGAALPRTAKRESAQKAASEDIYDDIIIYQSRAKPKLLPKPTNIKLSKLRKTPPHSIKDGKSLTPQAEADGHACSSSDEEHIYDDTVIKQMCRSTFTSFEDIYDDIIIKKLHHHGPSKPQVPIKPTSILSHPKVIELLRRKKWEQLQEIEEIYDLDPPEIQPDNFGSSDDDSVEEIYEDSAIIEEDEEQDGFQSAESKASCTGKTTKTTETLHNSNAGPPTLQPTGVDNDDDDEVYDELIIYEELGSSSNDAYQDIDQARAEALGLPKDIRMRSSRIVRGKNRKRLKQTLKRRSVNFSEDNGDPLPKDTEKESPAPEEKSATPVHEEGSSSEDETHDGYMSHDKARQVLDMLLEVNNVKKVAHKEKPPLKRSQSVANNPIQQTDDVTVDHVILPPEVEEYQRAGVLQTKTQSAIAAEIKFLTESAPKEPPPLPGQRPRKGNITNSEALSWKQKRLKKSLTLPNTNSKFQSQH